MFLRGFVQKQPIFFTINMREELLFIWILNTVHILIISPGRSILIKSADCTINFDLIKHGYIGTFDKATCKSYTFSQAKSNLTCNKISPFQTHIKSVSMTPMESVTYETLGFIESWLHVPSAIPWCDL